MADNFILPAAADVCAAEDVSGVKYQRVKLAVGAGATIADAESDDVTNALVGIDFAHHEVHKGSSFSVWTQNTSMSDTDVLAVAFKTAAGTKRVHLITGYQTLVGGAFFLYEGATWTTGTGTASDPIINRKRKASMDSSTILEDSTGTFGANDAVVVNATGLGVGSAAILQHFQSWGKKDKIDAGGNRDNEEIVLKPDTTYYALFSAVGDNNKGRIQLDWYEQTDKN